MLCNCALEPLGLWAGWRETWALWSLMAVVLLHRNLEGVCLPGLLFFNTWVSLLRTGYFSLFRDEETEAKSGREAMGNTTRCVGDSGLEATSSTFQ